MRWVRHRTRPRRLGWPVSILAEPIGLCCGALIELRDQPLLQRSLPARSRYDDPLDPIAGWGGGRGHCLRLELGTINTGRFVPPVRFIDGFDDFERCPLMPVNVLVLIPLVVSRLDNCPDPSIWDHSVYKVDGSTSRS